MATRTLNSVTYRRLPSWMQYWASVLLVALLGFIYRIVKSQWYRAWADEWLTIGYVSDFNSLQGYLFEFPIIQPHFPTYYMGLDVWLSLVGSSYQAARLYSSLWGLLGIVAIALLGVTLRNRRTGLIAALVLAFNPFHIYLSQTIRMYSMLICLSALSLTTFLRYRRRRTTLRLTAYVSITLLFAYTHVFAFFFVAAQLLQLLLSLDCNVLRGYFVPGMIIGVGLLPGTALLLWRVLLQTNPNGRGSIEAIPHVEGAPGLYDAGAVFVRLLVGRFNHILELVPLLLISAMALYAVSQLWHTDRFSATTLVAWVFLPMLVTGILSYVLFPLWDWNQARYLSPIMPAILVAFALGIDLLEVNPNVHPNMGYLLLVPTLGLLNTVTWLMQYLVYVF